MKDFWGCLYWKSILRQLLFFWEIPHMIRPRYFQHISNICPRTKKIGPCKVNSRSVKRIDSIFNWSKKSVQNCFQKKSYWRYKYLGQCVGRYKNFSNFPYCHPRIKIGNNFTSVSPCVCVRPVYCKCFCDLCVKRRVYLRMKYILVLEEMVVKHIFLSQANRKGKPKKLHEH